MTKNIKNFIVGESVICLLNNRASLTVGKLYQIKGVDSDTINIVNDEGYDYYYDFDRFMLISEFRQHNIDQILKK